MTLVSKLDVILKQCLRFLHFRFESLKPKIILHRQKNMKCGNPIDRYFQNSYVFMAKLYTKAKTNFNGYKWNRK
jgi:hypothetical protein